MGIFSMPFSEGTNPLVGAIGLLLMVIGFVLMLVGWVTYSRAKHEYDLYFDMRNQIEHPDVIRRNKQMKNGKIMLVASVGLIVLSLFLN